MTRFRKSIGFVRRESLPNLILNHDKPTASPEKSPPRKGSFSKADKISLRPVVPLSKLDFSKVHHSVLLDEKGSPQITAHIKERPSNLLYVSKSISYRQCSKDIPPSSIECINSFNGATHRLMSRENYKAMAVARVIKVQAHVSLSPLRQDKNRVKERYVDIFKDFSTSVYNQQQEQRRKGKILIAGVKNIRKSFSSVILPQNKIKILRAGDLHKVVKEDVRNYFTASHAGMSYFKKRILSVQREAHIRSIKNT